MVADALRRLILLEGPYPALVEDVREQLREHEGQAPTPVALVRLVDVDRALGLFEERRLSAEQLQEWADLLECNEHVDYEHGCEGTVADLLFRLSTPEINDPITPAVVRGLRVLLKNQGTE
jgi:hypothetical protein